MNNLQNDIDKYIDDITYKNNVKKKYKLKKEQFRKVTIVSKPQVESIKLNIDDISKIKQKPLGYELIKFRKKLYEKFMSENLNLLNNNLKTLKVKIKYVAPEILLLRFASGKYKFKKNKIELIKYFQNGSKNHEFLHMATSFYDKKLNLCWSGFQQVNCYKKQSIGYGLNEGYTELLKSRLFKEKLECVSYSYEICKFFAEKLEEIVEKDRMEKLYLNADLYGLYKYLLNFDAPENIASFIITLDYLLKHASIFNSKKQESHYALIECYLAKWYIEKMKQELELGYIDENVFNENINTYINSLQNQDLYIENHVINNNTVKESKTISKTRKKI